MWRVSSAGRSSFALERDLHEIVHDLAEALSPLQLVSPGNHRKRIVEDLAGCGLQAYQSGGVRHNPQSLRRPSPWLARDTPRLQARSSTNSHNLCVAGASGPGRIRRVPEKRISARKVTRHQSGGNRHRCLVCCSPETPGCNSVRGEPAWLATVPGRLQSIGPAIATLQAAGTSQVEGLAPTMHSGCEMRLEARVLCRRSS